MTFIFWQIMPSILESAFIRELANEYDVFCVAEIQISEKRKKHGWHIPDLGKTVVVIAPSEREIDRLLAIDMATHIFSGIQTYKLAGSVFRKAVKLNLKIGVICEPVNLSGFKGSLRFFKYLYLRMKYANKMDFILAIGRKVDSCFERVGFDKSKIYDWAYFTEQPTNIILRTSNKKVKLLFVGSIDKRKNILALVDVCRRIEHVELNIIGVGPLEQDLLTQIENTNCIYLGQKLNADVVRLMADADALVLPSLFDGWGAVTNEALFCGLPVILSDNCGASVLINGTRGRIFSIKKNNLYDVIFEFVAQLPYSIQQRENIKEWALTNLSGKSALRYFNLIIDHVNGKISEKPIAPWL